MFTKERNSGACSGEGSWSGGRSQWIGREVRDSELRCRDRGFDDRDLNAVVEAVDARVDAGVRLVRLDLRAFEPADTRVLAVLLYVVRRCQKTGATLIAELPRDLRTWAELMHVDVVLGPYLRRRGGSERPAGRWRRGSWKGA